MRTDLEQDPYAPPPRYKERSGAVMRFIILAALLGAAAWGYVTFASQQQQTASLAPAAQQEQRVAESGYQVAPVQPRSSGAPEQTPADAAPAQRNATRPAPTAPSEPATPPSTSVGPTPG